MPTVLTIKPLKKKMATAPTAATISTMKTGSRMSRMTKTGGAGNKMTIDDACASNESWSVLDSLTLGEKSAVPSICPPSEVLCSLNHRASFWSRSMHLIPN